MADDQPRRRGWGGRFAGPVGLSPLAHAFRRPRRPADDLRRRHAVVPVKPLPPAPDEGVRGLPMREG